MRAVCGNVAVVEVVVVELIHSETIGHYMVLHRGCSKVSCETSPTDNPATERYYISFIEGFARDAALGVTSLLLCSRTRSFSAGCLPGGLRRAGPGKTYMYVHNIIYIYI